MKPLMTIKDIAELLRVSERTVENMIKDGRAPPFMRMGRVRRWDPDVLQEWVRAQGAGQKPSSHPEKVPLEKGGKAT